MVGPLRPAGHGPGAWLQCDGQLLSEDPGMTDLGPYMGAIRSETLGALHTDEPSRPRRDREPT